MRRAVVIRTAGDPEIAEAIVDGMKAAQPKPLEPQAIEVVEAEIDRQRILEALVHVAVGNTNTPDDYANMVTKARGMYGNRRWHTRMGDAILIAWAMLWVLIYEAYDYLSDMNSGRYENGGDSRAG